MSNLRNFPRTTIRTLVTVLCEDPQGNQRPVVIKAWTEDISASGMQFACDEELPPGKIYVRILLPDLEDRMIECDVVRAGGRASTGIFRNNGPRYVYGVRFQKVRPLADFEAHLPPRASSNPNAARVLAVT
jgi:hypothetical protein